MHSGTLPPPSVSPGRATVRSVRAGRCCRFPERPPATLLRDPFAGAGATLCAVGPAYARAWISHRTDSNVQCELAAIGLGPAFECTFVALELCSDLLDMKRTASFARESDLPTPCEFRVIDARVSRKQDQSAPFSRIQPSKVSSYRIPQRLPCRADLPPSCSMLLQPSTSLQASIPPLSPRRPSSSPPAKATASKSTHGARCAGSPPPSRAPPTPPHRKPNQPRDVPARRRNERNCLAVAD